MANLFDQFDATDAVPAANPYDRFDAASASDGFRAPSDLEIRAYNPTLRDRTRNLLAPLSDLISRLGTVPEGMPQIPRVPTELAGGNSMNEAGVGIINTLTGLLNSTPTPVGVGLTLGGLPARLTGALMSPVMAQSAADNLRPTIDMVRNPNASVAEKTEAVLGEGLLGLGAVAPLAGMRRGPMSQTRDYGTITPDIVGEPVAAKRLALPEPLMERVAEKTPEQAVKAIREEIKLIEDPKKKAKLVDEADRIDREIAAREAVAEREQQALDAQDAQLKIVQDQQKAVENQAKEQQKAQENAQKLQIEQAKAQGEQVQAIMEANTPPEPLQAGKPMVLANSAAQSAKAIENNPENAQAQLNAITAPAQQPQQGQPQAPAQLNPAPAPTPEPKALVPIPKEISVEYLGERPTVIQGQKPVRQWQIFLPGEARGLTVTEAEIKALGFQPPKVSVEEFHSDVQNKVDALVKSIKRSDYAPGDDVFTIAGGRGRFIADTLPDKDGTPKAIIEIIGGPDGPYKASIRLDRITPEPPSRDQVLAGLKKITEQAPFKTQRTFESFKESALRKSFSDSEIYEAWHGKPMETIVSAAIRTTDGKVFPGKIHAEAFNAAEDAGKKVGANASDEGFVTSTGRYVTRQEAMKIAKEAGQNLKQSKGKEVLFVEHLDEGTNVLPEKGLTAEDLKPKPAANEPAPAPAPAPQAPGSTPSPQAAQPPLGQPSANQGPLGGGDTAQRGAIGVDALGSAAGSAGGGLYGFLSADKRDDETEEQFQVRRAIRAASFALGGGFAGSSAVRLFGRSKAVTNAQTLAKIQNEAVGIDSVPKWYQNIRQTGPMVKFREAINNSRAIVKDMVGNSVQAGTDVIPIGNPYATGKTYAAKVAEAQRKAKIVMDDLQAGVVEAAKASGIGVDNFINRFNIWMEARHTPDYNKHLADLHAATGGVGKPPTARLTDAEALQVRIDANKDGLTLPFLDLLKGYNGVVESIRDLLEGGGLITPETRKVWQQKFPNYVPMNRIMPDEDIDTAILRHVGGGPGLSVLGSGARKLKGGSDLDVADIAGNLMANWSDAITRVEKNEVTKSAGYFFKNLEFSGSPADGIEVRTPKAIGTGAGDKPIFEQFRPENMISYMVNGKPQWIVFRDPKVATAFSNLNSESQNRLMRLISVPTRVLSRAFTGYNLDFLVPNLVRDRQSAAWKALSQGDLSGALQQVNPARMAGDPAIVAQWVAGKRTPDTALFQQMMDDGGMPGGYASSTREKAQDFVETLRRADTNPAVWTVEKTKQVFNFLSEISEGSTRFRAYKRALELGATRQEAAIQALNSSIDFNQKGTATPSMGAFYAFFNPAAQGGVNAAKNLLRSKDAMAVLLAALVGTAASVDAWNQSFDPDWKKRKSFAHARTNGIPLIYGVDEATKELKYFTIPLSQEVRPIKAMTDFVFEMSNGEIKTGDNLQEELARVGGAIATASNPLGANPVNNPLTTVTPTVGRPLIEIASNRDFADRPIIPDRLRDSPLVQAHAQRNLQTYDSKTGRMAIKLSELLKENFNVEVSPEHMKYLVNSYGGGPARLVSSTINSTGAEPTGFKASDLPVVGSFMRRTTAEGIERTTPLYKQTEEKLSDAKTADELALQQSKLFFKHTFDKLEPKQWAPFWQKAEEAGLIPQDAVFRKRLINDLTDKIKGRSDIDNLVKGFGVENGQRAAYYASRRRDFKSDAEFVEFLKDQASKGLLDAKMVIQIKQVLDAGK